MFATYTGKICISYEALTKENKLRIFLTYSYKYWIVLSER